MAESSRQKRITGRVLHEFKHGELKSGRSGKGGKVKSRRQAIAIALQEAGASKYDSAKRNRRNLRRTEQKEARGRTAQQEREGKSHVGAYRKRDSTKAMAGSNARKQTAPSATRTRCTAPSRGGCPRPQSRRLYPSRTLREGKTEKRGRPLENVQAAAGERAGDRLSGLKAREYTLEEAEAFESKSRLAGFTGRNFPLEIGLELGKRPIKFVGSPRHLACLSDAFDRFLENVDDCSHCGQWSRPETVPVRPHNRGDIVACGSGLPLLKQHVPGDADSNANHADQRPHHEEASNPIHCATASSPGSPPPLSGAKQRFALSGGW